MKLISPLAAILLAFLLETISASDLNWPWNLPKKTVADEAYETLMQEEDLVPYMGPAPSSSSHRAQSYRVGTYEEEKKAIERMENDARIARKQKIVTCLFYDRPEPDFSEDIKRVKEQVESMKVDLKKLRLYRQMHFEMEYPLLINDEPVQEIRFGHSDEYWGRYFSPKETDAIYENLKAQMPLEELNYTVSDLLRLANKNVALALLSHNHDYHYYALNHLLKQHEAEQARKRRGSS